MSQPILSIRGLTKRYEGGTLALDHVDLDIENGEIFALLGPNGAGKTTMIGIVCGTITASEGKVLVGGHDHQGAYRAARRMIGLVPQELTTDAFESVWDTVSFSRGLFGKPKDPAKIEALLRRLSLWDKRSAKMMELSGGMKRRVMIAKALSHEPDILFLDEPSAGVDVALRRDMWDLVRDLRRDGTTIILTTHYIEEAEEMADRVGVIRKGQLVEVGDKAELMRRMGKRTMSIALDPPLDALPDGLGDGLSLEDEGRTLAYSFDAHGDDNGIRPLLRALDDKGVGWKDLSTRQSSLEDIFVSLVGSDEEGAPA